MTSRRRVEYVEDGLWRDILEPVFTNGFEREGVVVNARADFTQLRADLETGDLADVYILDNEIRGETKEGAQIALEIHQRAAQLNRDILVITLLCSAPVAVREAYGTQLHENGIPVCFKLTDVPVIGFYIGRCLEEGKTIDFQQWLTSEGINLPKDTRDATTVQDSITTEVEVADPGGFYLKPRDFIELHRENITRYMNPASIGELDRIFPMGSGIEVKR